MVDFWCNKVIEISCDILFLFFGGENIDGIGNVCNWFCYWNFCFLVVEFEIFKLCIIVYVIVFGVSGCIGFFRFKILV